MQVYLDQLGFTHCEIAILSEKADSVKGLAEWLENEQNKSWLISESKFTEAAIECLLKDTRGILASTDEEFIRFLKDRQASNLVPFLECKGVQSLDSLRSFLQNDDNRRWFMHDTGDSNVAELIIQDIRDAGRNAAQQTQFVQQAAPSPITVIHFYKRGEPFYEFTNFYAAPIVDDSGYVWATTEHYFQATKFNGVQDSQSRAKAAFERIKCSNNPRDAFDCGRDPLHMQVRRPDWESVKEDAMRFALFRKFTQHADLYHLLLSTGDAYIIEHTNNDNYWADGGDGTGKNRLGEILMELRQFLREKANEIRPFDVPPQFAM
eukprot:TRINITY_DN2655_c0_g1_i1.p1 TRINITY_DN2655_c0_g1~~TRINITY_DN2655_c0_g1_i1.p1  ORF type:complete len:321 (+),score=43.37 TRINITY_DN2655_c0_g1_i1:24-986(+)